MHRAHPRWHPDQHPGSLKTEVVISQVQASVCAVCLQTSTQQDGTQQCEITFVSGHNDVYGGFQKLLNTTSIEMMN
jgi:hypothetical protein